ALPVWVAARLGEGRQPLDAAEVLFRQVLVRPPPCCRQPRARGRRLTAPVLARQQTGCQREIGQQTEAIVLHGGDQVPLVLAYDQAVLVLAGDEAGEVVVARGPQR